MLIGCVDTRAPRKAIDQAVTRPMYATAYWLDIGNNAASGQYILGQPLNSRNRRAAVRLRTVSELYREIVDAAAGEDPFRDHPTRIDPHLTPQTKRAKSVESVKKKQFQER